MSTSDGSRQIGAFPVTFGRERVDQPPRQLMLVEEVDERFPVVIGCLHADHHRRVIAGRAVAAGSLHKLLEPAVCISHPESGKQATIG